MIPGIVGLAASLTRWRRERAEREQRLAIVADELRHATLVDALRVCLEQSNVNEVSGAVHVSTRHQGDELHVLVRLVIPFHNEAAA